MKSFFIITSCMTLLACNEDKQSKVDKQAEGEKVMEASRQWSQAASSGNVDKTVSYWADDAVMISAGQPTLNGKEEIRKMVAESFQMPGFKISWQPQRVEVSDDGTMAYLIEEARMTFQDSTGQTITQNNNTVTVWEKQADGSWKNVVDISTPK